MGDVPKPIRSYTIEMCDCREGSFRGEVETFYERDGDNIVCANCGTVPWEIPQKVPSDHRVELTVYHDVDDRLTEQYSVTLLPQ